MKKILAIILAMAMVLALAACGGTTVDDNKKTGMTEDILPRKAVQSSVTVPSDFKIGMICLHDENSTYDNNFIQALKTVQKGMGLSDEQVVIVTGIGEDSTCYDTAVDLAKNKGCKIIFADSFGHESFLKQAAQASIDSEDPRDLLFLNEMNTMSAEYNVDSPPLTEIIYGGVSDIIHSDRPLEPAAAELASALRTILKVRDEIRRKKN